jgi:carbon-monoxide dehydrogenase small subunit
MLVNGVQLQPAVDEDDLLLDVLRDAGITSVREGCGVGVCGACTALVDGRPLSTCLARAVRHHGAEIVTAEGLAEDDPVRLAFLEAEALQCGYCTPGFVLMVKSLLAENANPSAGQVDDHLRGNLCRCGAYPEIREAVRLAVVRSGGE